MAARADLAKIGREGFELIDEYFGRPAARRAAARPAIPQPPRPAEQPPRKKKEPAPVNCNQVAKSRGGIVITTWRAYSKSK